MLTTRRKDAHAAHIHRITERAAYYYNARPHPTEVAVADAELKRGINEDWRASVQRYPEVLEYFYGLVDLNLPSDHDTCIKDPPLSALAGAGARKVKYRVVGPDPRRVDGGRRSVPPGGGGGRRQPGPAFAPPPPPPPPPTAYGYGY